MRFSIAAVSEADCRPGIVDHLRGLSGPTDSFYESHVRNASHHLVLADGQVAALAAIAPEGLISLFTVAPSWAHLGPELFEQLRQSTGARAALVPSSDEGFLILALGTFRSLSVQAYAFERNRPAPHHAVAAIDLAVASADDASVVRAHAADFFEDVAGLIEDKALYVATHAGDVVGLGILERHRYRAECASVGMFVREDRRGKGIGTAIITGMIATCDDQRLTPLAGCAASNLVSKRTLERAGLAATGRLLRVEF